MRSAQKAIYAAIATCAIAWGFGSTVSMPSDAFPELSELWQDMPFVFAAAAAVAGLMSVAVICVMVHVVITQPWYAVAAIKVFVLGLPSISIGIVAAYIIMRTGLLNAGTPPASAIFGAVTYLMSGIAGIVAMKRYSVYREAF